MMPLHRYPCSGLHKPDDQTVLPPPEAAAFVAPLPVRALPGVGECSFHIAGYSFLCLTA